MLLKAIRLLWVVAGTLVAVSAVSDLAARLTADRGAGAVVGEVAQNLSVGIDFALPTWFASVLWFIVGALALLIAEADYSQKAPWRFLALVAFVASVDEYLMLHERLSGPASQIEELVGLDLGGATWVLGGVVVAVTVAVALMPLVLSLERPSRRRILMGAMIFLTGSIGLEVLHNLLDLTPVQSWNSVMVMHLEEALEMAGLIVAIEGLGMALPYLAADPKEALA